MSDAANRVAIVTGAASGIGRAATECLVSQGAEVLAVDIDEAKLKWTEAMSGIRTSTSCAPPQSISRLGAFGSMACVPVRFTRE
jgi:NAD(P)-dependent dehydrogenase (short-subunit alcohol dehydrogenase family)